MTLSDDLAQKIYQALLDGCGDAVNLCSFDRYLPFFQMPSFLESFEGRRMITSAETLRNMFDALQQGLRDIGASRMERTCSVAQFYGPQTIRGVHDTRLLDNKGQVVQAYSGLVTLHQVDGQWLIAASQFVGQTGSLPSQMLLCVTPDASVTTAAQ